MHFERVASGTACERISFDGNYLARLRSGDHDTAHHFNGYFRRVVSAKIAGLFDDYRGQDLMDKVMAAILEKILRGEPRDATRLVAYVHAICSNLAKVEMRPRLKLEQATILEERVSDGSPTVEQRLMAQERAAAVRSVLAKLQFRDRAVLVDLFYFELERDEVCRKHHVTREQLRLILFHARQRFQKEWRAGEKQAIS